MIALPPHIVELCRAALTRIDAEAFGWVTTHTWRKTVATRLDDAGLCPPGRSPIR